MANSWSAFGNFLGFFPLNIFNPQLIKSADVKAMDATPDDTGQLYYGLSSRASPRHFSAFPRTFSGPQPCSLVLWGVPLWFTILQLRPGPTFAKCHPRGARSPWHSSHRASDTGEPPRQAAPLSRNSPLLLCHRTAWRTRPALEVFTGPCPCPLAQRANVPTPTPPEEASGSAAAGACGC